MEVEIVEIKTEPLEDIVIKNEEPPDESYQSYEFVEVSEELLSTSIKHEEREIAPDHPLTLVHFQPTQILANVRPLHVIHVNATNQGNHTNQIDLSIFWKPFQEQGQLPLTAQTHRQNGLLQHKNSRFGKNLLRTISTGYTSLTLPAGWNMFFVKEGKESTLLIAQMCVEDGLPTMKRQIIINSALKIALFFGNHKINNIALCCKAIKSVQCIQSVVAQYAALNWCRGLSPDVQIERWAPVIMLDSYQNNHIFRHLQCKPMHGTKFDQCSDCKYLEVRDRKLLLVKKRSYMTFQRLYNRPVMRRFRRQQVQSSRTS